MRITTVAIPHKLRPNGTVMWSDPQVQAIMTASGVSLDARGVPKHPYETYRMGIDEAGVATYEIRQGERE